jgi:PilZ domain
MATHRHHLGPQDWQEERRTNPRVALQLLTYVSFGGSEDGDGNGGMVLDVSEGGFAIATAFGIPAVSVVEIVVAADDRHGPIEATGRVAWIAESKRRLGLQLIDVSPDALEAVRNWIAALKEMSLVVASSARGWAGESHGLEMEIAVEDFTRAPAWWEPNVPRPFLAQLFMGRPVVGRPDVTSQPSAGPAARDGSAGQQKMAEPTVQPVTWQSVVPETLAPEAFVPAGLLPEKVGPQAVVELPVMPRSEVQFEAQLGVQLGVELGALRAAAEDESTADDLGLPSDSGAAWPTHSKFPDGLGDDELQPVDDRLRSCKEEQQVADDEPQVYGVVEPRLVQSPIVEQRNVEPRTVEAPVAEARVAENRWVARIARFWRSRSLVALTAVVLAGFVLGIAIGRNILQQHWNHRREVLQGDELARRAISQAAEAAARKKASQSAPVLMMAADAPIPGGEIFVAPIVGDAPLRVDLGEEVIAHTPWMEIRSRRFAFVPGVSNAHAKPRKQRLDVGILTSRVTPEPPAARLAKTPTQNAEQTVAVRATIAGDGHVASVYPLSGPVTLIPSVLTAVRAWRYDPSSFNGKPIETVADLAIKFRPVP